MIEKLIELFVADPCGDDGTKGGFQPGNTCAKGGHSLAGTKVVDKNGKPLVVYHGTEAGDFDEFKPGSFFTEAKGEAKAYANITDTNNDVRMKYQDVKENGVSREHLINVWSEYGYGAYGDYEGEPNYVEYNGNTGRFFYWDGTTSPYGDKNIVILSGVKADVENSRGSFDESVTFGPTGDDEATEPRGIQRRVYAVHLDIKNPVKLPWDDANLLGRRLGATEEGIREVIDKYKSQGYDGIETESDDARVFRGRSVRQWIPFSPSQVHVVRKGEPEEFACELIEMFQK